VSGGASWRPLTLRSSAAQSEEHNLASSFQPVSVCLGQRLPPLVPRIRLRVQLDALAASFDACRVLDSAAAVKVRSAAVNAVTAIR
jgi:hypothetical protein